MAFVYILRSGSENLFKIGRTDGDVDARIRQLATGNPYKLTSSMSSKLSTIRSARHTFTGYFDPRSPLRAMHENSSR